MKICFIFEFIALLDAAELLIEDSTLFDYAGFTIGQIAIAENVNEELIKLKFNV